MLMKAQREQSDAEQIKTYAIKNDVTRIR